VLRISCPWCGPRDEGEFAFGGEAHIERPSPAATDAEWTGYLFLRGNPLGVHAERWRHARGCGQWFNVRRHTLTHEIQAIYPMGSAPPTDEGGGR
jgi:sarcosine oxidase subunit delta